MKAVEVPIAEALVEIPRDPEPGPALAPLVDELTRALVRVPGRGKHYGQKPPRDVLEVEKLSGSGHRERVGRVDLLAQRHHRWDRHRNPAPGHVRIEVLVVEVFSEDVEPLQLAVEEKPNRPGLGRDASDAAGKLVRERVDEMPRDPVAAAADVVVNHEPAQRIGRAVEQDACRRPCDAVVPPQEHPEALTRRRDSAAAAVNADADVRAEPCLAVLEEREKRRPLPSTPMFVLVVEEFPQRRRTHRQRHDGVAADDLAWIDGYRAREVPGVPLNRESQGGKRIGALDDRTGDNERDGAGERGNQARAARPAAHHRARARLKKML